MTETDKEKPVYDPDEQGDKYSVPGVGEVTQSQIHNIERQNLQQELSSPGLYSVPGYNEPVEVPDPKQIAAKESAKALVRDIEQATNPETVAAAKAASNGDQATEDTLLSIYGSVPSSIPEGSAGYMYKAQEIKKFMDENPDAEKSSMLQLGYAFCLFFGRLGGASANADTYSSFVSSFYNEERMSKEEIQKYLDKKYKEDTNKTLLKDSYLQCKDELNGVEEELKKNPKGKKLEELEDTKKFLQEKQKKLEEKLLPIDPSSIKRDGENGVDAELMKLIPAYEQSYNKDDENVKNIFGDQRIDFRDSMLSVEYVARILGGSAIQGNDPDRLYAKLLNSKYYLGDKSDKPQSPYLHLKDAASFGKRASQYTLAVNTVLFFSTNGSDESSFMMVGIVCPDHKIRFQTEKGLEVIDPFAADGKPTDKFAQLLPGFKGAFEAEESEYNTDIINPILQEKAGGGPVTTNSPAESAVEESGN